MSKKSYEFSREVKDEVWRRQRHLFPEGMALEVDHIVSIFQCQELGIPDWVCANILNAQLLPVAENRRKSNRAADPAVVAMMMSLIRPMF